MSWDYSYEAGCCLSCGSAHPGCLCYNCKCKKCSHYIHPSDWDGEHGKCDLCIPTEEQKKAFAIKKSQEGVKPHIPFKREVQVKECKPENAFDKEGWTQV